MPYVSSRRSSSFSTPFVFAALVLAGLSFSAGAQAPASLAVVDVDRVGPEVLAALKATPGLAWWVELDDQLLVAAEAPAMATLGRARPVRLLPEVPGAGLYVVRTTHRERLAEPGLETLLTGGGWAVLRTRQTAPELASHLATHGDDSGCLRHQGVFPLQPNQVLAQQWANAARQATPVPLAGVQSLVDEVDADRWFADVTTLATFNRWTRGADVLTARDWLVDPFEGLPGLSVRTESFAVGANTGWNVLATLTGNTRPDDWWIVGAHYDAISERSSSAAPGAEDNASGCAGVLEMARILAAHPPEATVIFICYSGEEQGLFGSSDHASRLVASGDSAHLRGALIMDMIGYTSDADLDCLLEANSASQSLIDSLAAAAAAYTDLRIVTSLNPFGSDHVPYLNRGLKALLTIENDWDEYPQYHRSGDLPAQLSLPMGGETLKMKIAALAQLAGATGAAAMFTDGFESGGTEAWSGTQP